MGGLAAAAENRGPEKNSSVKLKAFRLTSGCLKNLAKRTDTVQINFISYYQSSTHTILFLHTSL